MALVPRNTIFPQTDPTPRGKTTAEMLAGWDAEGLPSVYGRDPEDVAASIVYALKQPAHVAVNEVLIEPRDEPI